MARLARIVVPGEPHHVTQRGNHRERVFFGEDDYRAYLDLIASASRAAQTAIWAYCLMPNHVHFIMIPGREDSLRVTFAEAHRRYAARIHGRRRVTGHLWQGRFSSTAMDDAHLFAAVRYVSLNPVRAGLVKRAADWPWSSVRTHLTGRADGVVEVDGVLAMTGDFASYLDEEEDRTRVDAIRRSRTTGRPVGAPSWLTDLEARTGRALAAQRRGPKPRNYGDTV
ncbi:MAG TPA: transposase [Caulobacteraceae bacterium]|nr:transposase [Caulobacteraceae bacterium]